MSNQSYFFNPQDDRMSCAGSGFQNCRLSSASRLALSVTASDAGLTVFDTTLRELFVWTGTAWRQVQRYVDGIVQADKLVVDFAAIETRVDAVQADRFVVDFAAIETRVDAVQANRFVVDFAAIETRVDAVQVDKLVLTMIAMD